MGVIDTMIKNSQSASVTIITILFALWSATNGVNKLIESINKAYGIQYQQNTIKQRIFSILYTIIFIIMVVFILVSQIYGPSILVFIRDNVLNRISDKAFGGAFDTVITTLTSPLFRIIVTLVPLLIISLALGLFYKVAPQRREHRFPFKDAFKGGLLATLMIFIATYAYSFFLNNFSNQSVVYGALAGILALFIWLTIVTSVLIICAELIDSFSKNFAINSESEIKDFDMKNKTFRQTVEATIEESKNKENKDDNSPSKKDLRKHFRDLRYHMDPQRKSMVDYSIYSKFLNSDLFTKAESIFVYISVADEVDTIEIIKKSLDLGKKVYVPHITNPDEGIMQAVRIYDLDNLGVGEFDIPTSYTMQTIKDPDLTLVPGLGFDKNKNRVGYGGGYYDRFLNKHKTTSVGIFNSDFEVDYIPTNEFDHKLDYIITEKEIF